jgi:hypothetical protein
MPYPQSQLSKFADLPGIVRDLRRVFS